MWPANAPKASAPFPLCRSSDVPVPELYDASPLAPEPRYAPHLKKSITYAPPTSVSRLGNARGLAPEPSFALVARLHYAAFLLYPCAKAALAQLLQEPPVTSSVPRFHLPGIGAYVGENLANSQDSKQSPGPLCEALHSRGTRDSTPGDNVEQCGAGLQRFTWRCQGQREGRTRSTIAMGTSPILCEPFLSSY